MEHSDCWKPRKSKNLCSRREGSKLGGKEAGSSEPPSRTETCMREVNALRTRQSRSRKPDLSAATKSLFI